MTGSRVGGLLCFAAGCVFVVLGVVGERDVPRMMVGVILILIGSYWSARARGAGGG